LRYSFGKDLVEKLCIDAGEGRFYYFYFGINEFVKFVN
jgi:hypothetical protein